MYSLVSVECAGDHPPCYLVMAYASRLSIKQTGVVSEQQTGINCLVSCCLFTAAEISVEFMRHPSNLPVAVFSTQRSSSRRLYCSFCVVYLLCLGWTGVWLTPVCVLIML